VIGVLVSSDVRTFWLLAWLAVGATPDAASTPSQKTVMARAGAFVAGYTDELPRLVATETLTQDLTPPPGQTFDQTRRRSVAEFAWVTLAGESEALGFRDVIEVNGNPIGSERARLVDLVHGPGGGTWPQARAIIEQSARHNLVPGARNFNLPTVAVFFLHPDRQARFSWKRRSASDAPVWQLEFRERRVPTFIRQGDGRPIVSRGRVWIEVATGAILRTELELEFNDVAYALTTRFERVAAMDLVLPTRLDERYTTPDEVVTGTATYSNYRRFQTGARLLP
jgi:hypothetical protein